MNAEQRLELIQRVADWCYDHTESWAPDRIGLGTRMQLRERPHTPLAGPAIRQAA